MEHEVGTTNKPPKMMKAENYLTWKDRFQSFIEYQDARMWICIQDGYVNPTHDFEGRQRITPYVKMQENDKKMFEAEKKALAAIKMSLPDGIKHTFKKFTTSKEMWDALERRYEGNTDVKKNKIDLLKKQFAVFKYMKNESLEEIITRFYHLMSELDNYDIDNYTGTEINDKLLDALPAKWDIYTLMIKREANYEEKDLEEVVGLLRAYDLNMKKKETGYCQVQDPGVYKGIPPSSTFHNASSDTATAFLSCDNEYITTNSDGEVCYVATSGGSNGDKNKQASNQHGTKRTMPLSVKAAEDHLALLASFIASYENYIQGRISDPTTFDEDYDQVDPDDLEEMDLQWQMAMISRRVKRFMNRTGRKFVGKSVGFDKAKVRCFNCQSYGHFARECQMAKSEPQNQNSNIKSASNGSGSKALISTAREGSYDWSVHLEGDEVITQAFMAEIVVNDNVATGMDDTEKKTEIHQNGTKSEEEKKVSDRKLVDKDAALMATSDKSTREVNLNSTTPTCLTCTELQSEVEKLLTQNQNLSTDLSKIKESNFFLKRDESLYLKKIKGFETENKSLTYKLNEKIQIIDLAHDTMIEKTKEISDKNKELTDAQFKIIELEKKLDQFRESSFIMRHMMDNGKKSNDKTCVGFHEVPPPLSQNYSFLPNEHELINCNSTAPIDSTSNQDCELVNDDAKRDNEIGCILKNKKSPLKQMKQIYVKKVNFVKEGKSILSEPDSNDGLAKNENSKKFDSKQTVHNPSCSSSLNENSVLNELLRRAINLWYVDSGCSRQMTGDVSLLFDLEDYDGGRVNFAGAKGGKISGRGKVSNGKITLDKVNYVKELQHNLMSVSQFCDKGHSVLFNKSEALVLKPGFKISDDWLVMRAPRRNDTYVMDMGNMDSNSEVACLISKASEADSMLWHRRLGHIHFRKINYIIKNDLVRGVPMQRFHIEDKCLPCLKGKQHKKSHKPKSVNSIDAPYELLHMDLFGPVNVRSIGGKYYCLVVTDDYSRYSWVLFLASKDETTELLIDLFTKMENVHEAKIKRLRSDNGSEFKNQVMNLYCLRKGIDHQFTAPYNPQQNGVAERKNRTLIEAARTMLSDSKLPVLFWGEAVNTACYVLNKVVFNVEITSYKPQQSTSGPEILYDYESLFKSFNLPDLSNEDSSQVIQTILSEDEGEPLLPSSNITRDSDSEPIQSEGFTNPFATVQGEIGSNLEDDIIVDSIASSRINKDHPVEQILGDPNAGVQTRKSIAENSGLFASIQKTGVINDCFYSCFIAQSEPKNVSMALKDNAWVEAMQEELAQFKKLKVWELVDLPATEKEIGTKWIFKCKRDDRGIVIRNKARLVVKGFNQQEGIDYNEVFAPVARLEAIRLFLAFASFKGFKVFQLDVKSAFLYGKVQELVYVSQPEGFVDPDFPDRVYKLDKALYGLHQAPRAWYETLSSHLIDNGFERGQIDSTLFIKRKKADFLLVQVYVDDIIFGSSNEEMCHDFEMVMKGKFEMSAMGELSYFLGLQVEQKKDGMFIHQSKYVYDILSRFKMEDSTEYSTPICVNHNLGPDHESEDDVDPTQYRAMIGSLMYLTASRPDIMFAVCLCARFQANPKESHMKAVKRILRYLKGKPKLGLWYPNDSDLDLVAYTDSDYGGCKSNRKSTTGGCQFLGGRIVSWQCKKQSCVSTSTCEAEYIAAGSCCSQVLWIQQQMRDYGLNFFRTPIMIDNNATISITNNPVKHSKTKHIDIRHHFIRDCAEKKLIELHKVDTLDNLADLYTKAFDKTRFALLTYALQGTELDEINIITYSNGSLCLCEQRCGTGARVVCGVWCCLVDSFVYNAATRMDGYCLLITRIWIAALKLEVWFGDWMHQLRGSFFEDCRRLKDVLKLKLSKDQKTL
ncbi:hypothetical protein L1887_32343 [Cichorium endivia]|nr:hypothetical protein L1887_32343 [Cichorium endivia]